MRLQQEHFLSRRTRLRPPCVIVDWLRASGDSAMCEGTDEPARFHGRLGYDVWLGGCPERFQNLLEPETHEPARAVVRYASFGEPVGGPR